MQTIDLVEFAKLQVADFWKLQLSMVAAFFAFCWTEGVFGLLFRGRRGIKPPPELVTDLFYWVTLPAAQILSRFLVAPLVLLTAIGVGLELGPELYNGFGPVARQPRWLILVELVVLIDFATYWMHRLFHMSPFLWRFHAIHHSATFIRWSTTGRMHVFNEFLNYTVSTLPFFLLGFPMRYVLWLAPILVAYAVGAHTQWNIGFGPLNTLFACPRFHRWHHTHSHEGGNKNFSNLFSLWDRLFGTFYLPAERLPEVFGLDENDMPESFLGQLEYPFRQPGAEPQRAVVSERADEPSS